MEINQSKYECTLDVLVNFVAVTDINASNASTISASESLNRTAFAQIEPTHIDIKVWFNT